MEKDTIHTYNNHMAVALDHIQTLILGTIWIHTYNNHMAVALDHIQTLILGTIWIKSQHQATNVISMYCRQFLPTKN